MLDPLMRAEKSLELIEEAVSRCLVYRRLMEQRAQISRMPSATGQTWEERLAEINTRYERMIFLQERARGLVRRMTEQIEANPLSMANEVQSLRQQVDAMASGIKWSA
jgi:hypothetical protein